MGGALTLNRSESVWTKDLPRICACCSKCKSSQQSSSQIDKSRILDIYESLIEVFHGLGKCGKVKSTSNPIYTCANERTSTRDGGFSLLQISTKWGPQFRCQHPHLAGSSYLHCYHCCTHHRHHDYHYWNLNFLSGLSVHPRQLLPTTAILT